MKVIFYLLVVAVSFFQMSCENETNPAASTLNLIRQDGLESTFAITDAAGNPKLTFDFGEDIRFSFVIENRASIAQVYEIDGGPIVVIEIFSEGQRVGSTEDGLEWIQQNFTREIEAKGKLERSTSWLLNPNHINLPPGDYIAKARPRLRFKQARPLPTASIDFTVACSSGDNDCPDITPVVIFDIQPGAIHLDSFSLNDAALSGDTLSLNISYGGGCAEHDFALFASGFLESNPVQVNLHLRHNDHDDPCDAVVTREVLFDLKPIAKSYQESYGRSDPVILNVFEFYTSLPRKVIKLEYRF